MHGLVKYVEKVMQGTTIDKTEATECFKNSKMVYLVTFSKDGKMSSRPMTNLNDNPYETFWFPSYRDTRKISEIKENPKVLVLYQCKKKNQFYEIKGKARFADRHEVEEKWVWWYLYLHPELEDYFWFDQTEPHPERVIIKVEPEAITRLDKSEICYVRGAYKSVQPVEEDWGLPLYQVSSPT
jgi:general stress protein 26